MSSTYSSNLRLELISSGEQANTWGNTTNTNLGTLLEQAVTGITDVDISAGNVTLTALDGAYDQARGAVLAVSGAAGTTRTIFTPANVSKVYIVDNAASDDVVISTLAAGTPVGVTVPAGTAKLVYTDGTDFYEGSNAADVFTATDITADTVTITGTPTNATDAITKGYGSTTFYPRTGGTLNGPLTSTGDISVSGSGAVLRFADGTTQATAAATATPSVPSGSVMLFYQASAPLGWTQVTTQNNKALRVVSGTGGGSGGTQGFSTVFTSKTPAGAIDTSGLSAGNTTLTTAQMPSHNHSVSDPTHAHTFGAPSNGTGTYGLVAGGGAFNLGSLLVTNYSSTGISIGSAGSGGAHNHAISGSATFTGTAIDLSVQYIDIILCSKN